MPFLKYLPLAVILLGLTTSRAVADVGLEEGPSLTTPRSALTWFLENARRGDFAASSTVLGPLDAAFPDGEGRPDGALLARQLKAVLDTWVWFDLEAISDAPEGRLNDRLPPDLEEVGRVPVPGGWEPVRMQRVDDQWFFSPSTVARVPDWYAQLPDRWVRDHLPEPLLRPGPRELLWWQWIAIPLLFALALVAGRLLAVVFRPLLRLLARRSRSSFADALSHRINGPLALLLASLIVLVLLHRLALAAPGRAFVDSVVHALILLSLFWAALRSVELAAEAFRGSRLFEQRQELHGLLPVLTRLAKVALFAIALVTVLQQMGYPVASLIAGLGIGGLAVALAAQKTVENLFGSFTLGVDQPFRQGDFVKVDDLLGTVEAVGLRSTRIRTLDRTLVTLPNGRLADSRIESFSARDRCRLFAVIGLVYGTRADQMRRILEEIVELLRSHPLIWPDTIRAVFREFNQSSLDVEVLAWFQTGDWGEFLQIRQEILLQIMEIVERNGTSFAFPSRTIHLVGPKEPAGGQGDDRS